MRVKNIDFLRFLFALIIVYFHIFSSMSGGMTKPEYKSLATGVTDGYLVVELFFILSGYFMYLGYKIHNEKTWSNFAYEKICRLWPLMAFVLLFNMVAYKNSDLSYTAFLNLFFLQSSGLVLNYQRMVYLWFISALFWSVLFYYALLKNFSLQKFNLLTSIIVLFAYAAVLTRNGGSMYGAGGPVLAGFINIGLLRALAGVGWGILLAQIYEILNNLTRPTTKAAFALFSLIELGCFCLIVFHLTASPLPYRDKFVFIVAFSCLLLSFCLHLGVCSRLLENNFSFLLGKYSYAIYVTQGIAFYICQRSLWQQKEVVDAAYLNISLTLLLAVMIGVAAHHLLEKPAKKFLMQKMSAFQQTKERLSPTKK